MSTPTIIGFPQSTYVWTARTALAHKGVDYEFKAIAPPANRTPEHLALHPWGKVPVFTHGELTLYETTAICVYADAAFEGPALYPSDAAERARVVQIESIANAYLYPPAVVRYALQYIFPQGEGGAPDRATIEGALPDIELALKQLDDLLGEGKWFVGDSPSAADFMVAPLVAVVGMFPEGKELAGKFGKLGRLLGQLMQMPAFASSATPRG